MSIMCRVYNDYIMKNRYKDYEKMLKSFIKNGYEFLLVKDYQKLVQPEKHIILRHDIDSDIKIAKRMFEIEKKLGIKSTYYFRLCTMNKEFIKEIVSYGSEVGYHYEELAQFCKDNKQINFEFVQEHIEDIKSKMIENVKYFQEKNDIQLYSIAAHGDFINRKINVSNQFIYQKDLQDKLNLIEAYNIEDKIDFRTADTMYPKFWKEDPEKAIIEEKRNILLLVHPRWWKRAPIERIKLDFRRMIEKLKYEKN